MPAAKGSAKTRKERRGFGGPASLLRCRAARPFGTFVRRRGTFRPLGHAPSPMVSHKTARRPDHGPYLPSRCYDVTPVLAGLKPISSRISGAKYPAGFTTRYCGDTARPWDFASTFPAAFGRPWHWATSGLPCPCERAAHVPEPLDFSFSPVHNQRTR